MAPIQFYTVPNFGPCAELGHEISKLVSLNNIKIPGKLANVIVRLCSASVGFAPDLTDRLTKGFAPGPRWGNAPDPPRAPAHAISPRKQEAKLRLLYASIV